MFRVRARRLPGAWLGVRYASQQISRKGRKYLKSQRLRRFLGEYPGITTIRKPLFMHGKTYSGSLNKLRHIEANRQSRKYKSKRLTERTLNIANVSPHDIVIGHAPARLRRRSAVARASQRITSHVNSADTVDRPGRCRTAGSDIGWRWPSRLVATAEEDRLASAQPTTANKEKSPSEAGA